MELPERVEGRDLALIALASHKLSRLIAKAKVTSFLRAPFKRYEDDDAAPGELNESTRGTGLRAAVGEMIGCPWCLDLWLAAGFSAGVVVAPRETRFVASIFGALAGADFLNVAYKALEHKGLGE